MCVFSCSALSSALAFSRAKKRWQPRGVEMLVPCLDEIGESLNGLRIVQRLEGLWYEGLWLFHIERFLTCRSVSSTLRTGSIRISGRSPPLAPGPSGSPASVALDTVASIIETLIVFSFVTLTSAAAIFEHIIQRPANFGASLLLEGSFSRVCFRASAAISSA